LEVELRTHVVERVSLVGARPTADERDTVLLLQVRKPAGVVNDADLFGNSVDVVHHFSLRDGTGRETQSGGQYRCARGAYQWMRLHRCSSFHPRVRAPTAIWFTVDR